MDSSESTWHDPKVHQLYFIATTSKNLDLRREALRFLGALKRAGSEDAARAMERIRKDSGKET